MPKRVQATAATLVLGLLTHLVPHLTVVAVEVDQEVHAEVTVKTAKATHQAKARATEPHQVANTEVVVEDRVLAGAVATAHLAVSVLSGVLAKTVQSVASHTTTHLRTLTVK